MLGVGVRRQTVANRRRPGGDIEISSQKAISAAAPNVYSELSETGADWRQGAG
jgi:hypothetical protein